ncbi:MAG: hypothetical protein IPJ32_08205 [Sphingobacteriaceae bacterium]|nr:hypothetical protein [Sphingobacteriaceae bacterium]
MEFAKRRDFDGEGKYEVYFNEPVEKEQKKILDNVMKDKSKPFTLKEIENLENVIRTLQNNNYRRFSEKL